VALADKEIQVLKPQAKRYKVFDGEGLYLRPSERYAEGRRATATEDLSLWTTSSGSCLEPCPVVVEARKGWDSGWSLP